MNDHDYPFRNRLLRSLSGPTLVAVSRHLEREPLDYRRTVLEPGKPIDRVCFPERGLISVVAVSRGGGRIEAGVVGPEGMVGAAVLLADDRTPNEAFVQFRGEACFMAVSDLHRLVSQHPDFHRVMLRFVHSFLIQLAHNALADGRARLDQRLARWLLMALDRSETPQLPVTHETLAAMLGVRRAGVTVALNQLERLGSIRMSRGVVTVLDRPALEAVAGAWYGAAETEYRRLFGEWDRAEAA